MGLPGPGDRARRIRRGSAGAAFAGPGERAGSGPPCSGERRSRTIRGVATFFPTRSRGQNFLHDRGIAERFAAVALEAAGDSGPPRDIVEIGPGKGALTFPLLAAGARVLAIEVDSRLVRLLEKRARERGVAEGLRLVQGDALRLDLADAIGEFGAAAPLPICGNLPFSVASPLLLRLIEGHAAPGRPPLFDALTLTLQREVAGRIVARRGDPEYGALSVVVQQALVPKIRFLIQPRAFRPRPRVVSAVLRLTPRPDPPAVGPERHFRSLVRGLFAHRRKTLRNGIAHLGAADLAARVAAALDALGLDPGLRPEQLGVDDFAAVSRLSSG